MDATTTAYLLGVNRDTVNQLYLLFLEAIYHSRVENLHAMLLTKEVAFDEAYLGAKRLRGRGSFT